MYLPQYVYIKTENSKEIYRKHKVERSIGNGMYLYTHK